MVCLTLPFVGPTNGLRPVHCGSWRAMGQDEEASEGQGITLWGTITYWTGGLSSTTTGSSSPQEIKASTNSAAIIALAYIRYPRSSRSQTLVSGPRSIFSRTFLRGNTL